MTDAHAIEAVLGVAAYAVVFLFFLIPVVRLFFTRDVKDDLDELGSSVNAAKAEDGALAPTTKATTTVFDPVAQRVGDVYVRWLQSCITETGNLFDANVESFEEELKRTITGVAVVGATCRYGGDLVRVDVSSESADAQPWWVVALERDVVLVPRPVSGGKFGGSSRAIFDGHDVVPAAVRRAVAARLEEQAGSDFVVTARGLLSEVVRENAIETDADIRTLPALEANRYGSPLVREAVQQIAAAYPGGDYRRFDLLCLPTHADYTERVGTARNMAGLFVLVGLGLTMVRLNGVVGEIAGAASEQGMSPDAFIAKMGALMGNIGGAFTASIAGLVAMVVALLLLSIIDRAMQSRFARVEHAISDYVLPVLVQIQERDMPTATLPAVLRATQKNIERLDATVQGLTTGMAASLEGMGTRITDLLEQLGTYQRRSADLDTMLREVSGTAAQLGSVVHKLDAAATRMVAPMDQLVNIIATPLDEMARAVASSEAGYQSVAAEMRDLRQHLNAATERTEALMASSAAQQREQLAAIGGHLKGFSEGARELGPVAKSFAQAAAAQNAATRELQTTSQRLSGTGQTLQRAAEQFQRHGPAIVPPSMFAWFYNGVISTYERMSGQTPGGWSRYDGPRGDGAPAAVQAPMSAMSVPVAVPPSAPAPAGVPIEATTPHQS